MGTSNRIIMGIMVNVNRIMMEILAMIVNSIC